MDGGWVANLESAAQTQVSVYQPIGFGVSGLGVYELGLGFGVYGLGFRVF